MYRSAITPHHRWNQANLFCPCRGNKTNPWFLVHFHRIVEGAIRFHAIAERVYFGEGIQVCEGVLCAGCRAPIGNPARNFQFLFWSRGGRLRALYSYGRAGEKKQTCKKENGIFQKERHTGIVAFCPFSLRFKAISAIVHSIAGSSNGRTHASGAWYLGSSPSPAEIRTAGGISAVA